MIKKLRFACSLAFAFLVSQNLSAQGPVLPKANKGQQGPTRPNIIMIVADDLGYGDLGSYGQKYIKTPYLDRLAAEGMRFTHAYAGAPIGGAARASLMTGLHTGHTYIRGNKNIPLRAKDITIAEVLRQARYKTIALGKWGLGLENTTGEPFKKGFEHWAGFTTQEHADNYYPQFLWRFEPGFKGVNAFHGMVPIYRNREGRRVEYSQDLITKAALNSIRIYRPAFDNKYQPFFLYISYTTPHANNDLFSKTGNGMEVPHNRPYSQYRWPLPERNKAAMITRLDADVGKIVDKIAQYKMEKDTIIIFTSDNGPHAEGGVNPTYLGSAGPLRGIKRSLYEGGIRVPLIIRWTGKTKANTISELPVGAWDFMPTLAQIARSRAPRDLDGVSFLATLQGLPQTQKHEFLYWEFHEGGSKQAARMGDWKVVRPALGDRLELYNLKTDIGETKNVAAQHPDVIIKFENFLRTARTRSTHWPLTKATPPGGR
ncbi:MAG: N-acetylgalactosamine-6-sulfatase [Verrucomicrobiales bacterium]|nr:N-acetylgalactosamine-6-sulfatase [Verrucomicrobiales bacterium]|tara:strand:- start:36809 stop:38266 length:1458 start_codon:yes stop_codon:yes gene_type:complete